MKILFAQDYSRSGTERMMLPIARCLRDLGHTVDILEVDKGRKIPPGFDLTLSSYDYCHVFNGASLLYLRRAKIPLGFTLHGMIHGSESWYIKLIRDVAPRWVHVLDTFTQRQLGQEEIASTHIPQTIDTLGLVPLAYPSEFTVGYLGGEYKSKRFSVIEEIARRAGVPCKGYYAKDGEWLDRLGVLRVYKGMSLYICASWNDGGPVPPQEALLCGRPVLTTPVGQMPETIVHRMEGMFFNGTVEEGVERVLEIKRDFEWYSKCARNWHLPTSRSPEVVTKQFLTAVEKIL